MRGGQRGEMRIQERKHAWEKDLHRACGEEKLQNTDLNKSDNEIRATKVYNREEKDILDKEGLQYSCHGDEQVSQASSFL